MCRLTTPRQPGSCRRNLDRSKICTTTTELPSTTLRAMSCAAREGVRTDRCNDQPSTPTRATHNDSVQHGRSVVLTTEVVTICSPLQVMMANGLGRWAGSRCTRSSAQSSVLGACQSRHVHAGAPRFLNSTEAMRTHNRTTLRDQRQLSSVRAHSTPESSSAGESMAGKGAPEEGRRLCGSAQAHQLSSPILTQCAQVQWRNGQHGTGSRTSPTTRSVR